MTWCLDSGVVQQAEFSCQVIKVRLNTEGPDDICEVENRIVTISD